MAVRPGMARYGQVFTENLRTSSFQPVFSPFRPLHLCFLRARLRASGASLDRVNHPKIRRNIKIHQGTRHIRLGTQWIYSESVPSTSFNHLQHKIPSSLYIRSIQSNQSIDLQSITYPSFVDLHHGSIWFPHVPSHHLLKISASPPSTPCVGLPPCVGDPWELQTALRRP